MYIDTHCHLTDEKLSSTESVVKDFLQAGVLRAISMGCTVNDSEQAKNISESFKEIYFAAGIHPGETESYSEKNLLKLLPLLGHRKCVAVGEIGLDYHWEGYNEAKQKDLFVFQLEIANRYKLPVSVHVRDALQDSLEILKTHKPLYGGVIHCFSGSVETAKIFLDNGFYLGFGGTLTFKNAAKLLKVAEYVPEDLCLTETDSPYLAPHPLRGSVNEPKNIPIVLSKLAELKGKEMLEMANCVNENAHKLFFKLNNV